MKLTINKPRNHSKFKFYRFYIRLNVFLIRQNVFLISPLAGQFVEVEVRKDW